MALILACIIFLSSVKEGAGAVYSSVFSMESCSHTDHEKKDATDNDVNEQDENASCCTTSACDCTCCVHIPLFTTYFAGDWQIGEISHESINHLNNYEYDIYFSFFHPPTV